MNTLELLALFQGKSVTGNWTEIASSMRESPFLSRNELYTAEQCEKSFNNAPSGSGVDALRVKRREELRTSIKRCTEEIHAVEIELQRRREQKRQKKSTPNTPQQQHQNLPSSGQQSSSLSSVEPVAVHSTVMDAVLKVASTAGTEESDKSSSATTPVLHSGIASAVIAPTSKPAAFDTEVETGTSVVAETASVVRTSAPVDGTVEVEEKEEKVALQAAATNTTATKQKEPDASAANATEVESEKDPAAAATNTLESEAKQKEPDPEEVKRLMLRVVGKLLSHDYSTPFRHPVDVDDVPDYPKFVKQPTDLQTIKTNILEGRTTNFVELWRDLSLMFTNAQMFNAPETEIYKCAKALRALCRKEVAVAWRDSYAFLNYNELPHEARPPLLFEHVIEARRPSTKKRKRKK